VHRQTWTGARSAGRSSPRHRQNNPGFFFKPIRRFTHSYRLIAILYEFPNQTPQSRHLSEEWTFATPGHSAQPRLLPLDWDKQPNTLPQGGTT
jgi:hypothetical protein